MPPRLQSPRDQLDRLLALVRRSFRYLWVAALIAALGTAASVAFALSRDRVYESRTVILHREVIPAELLQGPAGIGRTANMDSRFREMAMAAPLLQEVIEQYDLYPKVRAEKGLPGAIEEMREDLEFGSRGGGTFNITYRGDTPEQAQQVAQGIADRLIEWEVQIQTESVSATKGFLDKERDRAEQELIAKEKRLAGFLAEHPEFAQESADVMSGAAGASIRFGKKENQGGDSRNPRLRALERQRARIMARLENKPPPEPSGPEAEPRTPLQKRAAQRVEIARNEVNKAQSALDDVSIRYTERHPDAVSAARRLEAAEQRLVSAQADLAEAMGQGPPIEQRALTAGERGKLEREAARLARDIAAVRRSEQQADPRPASQDPDNWVVKLETEWAQLFREVREARERYDALDAKAFTAEIVAASEAASRGSQLTIVDPAFLPTRPAGAGRTVIVLAGMFVFAALGAAVALGLALVDDRVIGPYDIEKLEIAPFLVSVPRASKRGRRRG